MSKTAILRTRVDAQRKSAAEAVFKKLGISMGDAISIFLNQVSIQKAIPFPLTTQPHLDLSNATVEQIEERYSARVPTPETEAALNEGLDKARRFKSATQLLKVLKA